MEETSEHGIVLCFNVGEPIGELMPRKKKPVIEDWNCHCETKLGEMIDGVLHIKYNSLRVQIQMDSGDCTVVCPRCGWVKRWQNGKVSVEYPAKEVE